MRFKNPTMFIIIILLIVLSACNSRNTVRSDDEGKLLVYTSFYIMYDFTLKIAGDKVNIKNMVPNGMGPHDWEPTPKDIANLYNADLFIYNGCGMESWVVKVLESISNSDLVSIETSKNVEVQRINSAEHDHFNEGETHSGGAGGYDPHVWLNPLNAKIQMEAIKDGLIQVDPSNGEFYQDNYEFYAKKLDALDEAYKSAANEFARKEIVVSHEAFGYLCSAYGLTQIAIEGISSESEPTPAKMAQIIKFVKKNDLKVIFFEELASPKVAEAIARETGAEIALLNPLGGLSEESLNAGKEYFFVMEENLEALKKALR